MFDPDISVRMSSGQLLHYLIAKNILLGSMTESFQGKENFSYEVVSIECICLQDAELCSNFLPHAKGHANRIGSSLGI